MVFGLFKKQAVAQEQKPKVEYVSETTVQKDVVSEGDVTTFTLRVFDDVQHVADHLKDKKAVVLDLTKIHREDVRRVLDFLSGVIYTLNGKVKQIQPRFYMFTPPNVLVQSVDNLDAN